MTIEIPLTRGKVALVDDEDLPLVAGLKWSARRDGDNWYAAGTIDGEIVLMHRRILGLSRGDGVKTDHWNGDGLDNTRGNLRIASTAQNMANRRVWSKSGFRGVHRSGRLWVAQIGAPVHRIGGFSTPEEAAVAYDAEARSRYGAFACLNFPLPGERSALTGKIMPLAVAA